MVNGIVVLQGTLEFHEVANNSHERGDIQYLELDRLPLFGDEDSDGIGVVWLWTRCQDNNDEYKASLGHEVQHVYES